jgi:hypothetical protein
MGGICAVSRLKLALMAIPKKAIHRAGWTREEMRRVLNRKNRIMSRQKMVRKPRFICHRLLSCRLAGKYFSGLHRGVPGP